MIYLMLYDLWKVLWFLIVQDFTLNVMDELPHEQIYDNKIGVIDLETYPFDKTDEEIKAEISNNIYSNSGKQKVYARGLEG